MKSGEDGAVIIGEGSHPSRGAWIEIGLEPHRGIARSVAPLTGCVD